EELEKHRGKRLPKPDLTAENATDGVAIVKLERDAPDVLRALQNITKQTLLRDIAPMLDATADDADTKDEEKGTPFNSRIRRLTRVMGTAKPPGTPAPFTPPRTGGRTSPHRLIPIAPTRAEKLHPGDGPSDPPPAS